MGNVVKLDLARDKVRGFCYSYDVLSRYINDMDDFLDKHQDMNNINFAKRIMMGLEIQSNNSIEGIKDDLDVINRVINKLWGNISLDEKTRIINLYKGYQYILKNNSIDKEHLRELYAILSKDLLDQYSQEHMGKYYRKSSVYISREGYYSFKKTIDCSKVSYFMDDFFDFVHDDNDYSNVDSFLKSQIMHLYFVYVHPYFDVNGRTARTVSMWYLLNHDDYIFVIFNRAISYYRQKYIENVGKSIDSGNITDFLRYMLVVVLRELEREDLICNVCRDCNINILEEQILEYFFMIPGEVSLGKLFSLYYHYNPRINYKEIYFDRIDTLIDKNVFVVDGKFGSDMKFYLNKKCVDLDCSDFKYLSLKKKLK